MNVAVCTAGGESIPGCHRSKAAQVVIGDGVLGYNLACSGARTANDGHGSGLIDGEPVMTLVA